jgi:hypothetical protein
MAIGNYAAINWFIVGCFVFFLHGKLNRDKFSNKIQYLLLLILSLPLNCGDFN